MPAQRWFLDHPNFNSMFFLIIFDFAYFPCATLIRRETCVALFCKNGHNSAWAFMACLGFVLLKHLYFMIKNCASFYVNFIGFFLSFRIDICWLLEEFWFIHMHIFNRLVLKMSELDTKSMLPIIDPKNISTACLRSFHEPIDCVKSSPTLISMPWYF